MTPDRWEQIAGIWRSALCRAGGQRSSYLDQACGPDATLRAEIESLLRRDAAAGSFLEPPSSAAAAGLLDRGSPDSLVGRRIGRYTICGVLGRGGMGIVYEAQQDNPARTVALKVLHTLPFADELTSRLFRREGQALARLDHNGIATIHEAGSDERHCYIAMERVEGTHLIEYARTNRLSLRQRLTLFRRICDAVHYAHQRGIIHRDLKPSNLLVTAAGLPKVLDFGLARIVDPETSHTQFTEMGAFLGTLAYASPEQVRGGEVDTRSDVYSLGVILFQLLTGQLPYELRGKPLPEAARKICDQRPRSAGLLDRALRGELETILAKALEKLPNDRYTSAAALGDDIQRYLERRPIIAHPPSLAYQFRKFIGRNRLAAALTGTMLVIVIGASIVTAWLALRYADQRDAAVAAQTGESQERQTAEETAAFLAKLFEQADPERQQTADPTARELLDAGVTRLQSELADRPLVRARLMVVIGKVYTALADYPKALELLRSGVEIVRRERGNDHPDLIEPLAGLGAALGHSGAPEEGHQVLLEQLRICELQYGPRDKRVAAALTEVGTERFYSGDHATALEYFQRSLDLKRELFGEASLQYAEEVTNVGYALNFLRRFDEAEAILRRGLEVRKRLGSDPAGIGLTLDVLAHVAMGRNDPATAEAYLTEQVALYKQAFHDGSPAIAFALHNLAYVVGAARGPAAAEPIYREALDRRRACYGEQHPRVALTMSDLGLTQMEQGKFEEAIALLKGALEIRRALWGDCHEVVAASMQKLGEAYRRAGNLPDAEPLLLKSYEIVAASKGPTGQHAIPSVGSLVAVCRALDRPEETARWLQIFGESHMSMNNRTAAAAAFREAADIYAQIGGPDDTCSRECLERLQAAEINP